MKIGLLGGSFNPAHQGHIYISKSAIKKLQLQQIWWVPTLQNPLKDKTAVPYKQRFTGCLEITKNHPQIYVKDFQKDSFYAIDLVKKLRAKYPRHQFYWVMGDDNLEKFYLWKKVVALVKIIDVAVFARLNLRGAPFSLRRVVGDGEIRRGDPCGRPHQACQRATTRVATTKTVKFQIFNTKKYELSSTEIRQHR